MEGTSKDRGRGEGFRSHAIHEIHGESRVYILSKSLHLLNIQLTQNV